MRINREIDRRVPRVERDSDIVGTAAYPPLRCELARTMRFGRRDGAPASNISDKTHSVHSP